MYLKMTVNAIEVPGRKPLRFGASGYTKIALEDVKSLMTGENIVGSDNIAPSDAATVLCTVLGLEVIPTGGFLNPGYALVVANFTGNSIPEGATSLPEGTQIEFWVSYGK